MYEDNHIGHTIPLCMSVHPFLQLVDHSFSLCYNIPQGVIGKSPQDTPFNALTETGFNTIREVK